MTVVVRSSSRAQRGHDETWARTRRACSPVSSPSIDASRKRRYRRCSRWSRNDTPGEQRQSGDTSREWHDRRVGFRRVARIETDEEAFERHVLPEVEVLLRVARSMTRNHADAEDLVQDTLIRAYRGIGGFDGRYPRAWLLTILRNTNINRNRRRRPELLRDQDATFERLESDSATDRADVLVEQVIDGEILAALDTLSDDFRRVVELVDIDGLSYVEAAEVLGVPVGTVMSRLHRARRRIRDRLDRAGLAPRIRV